MIELRVPYPMGFFAKGLDGRIDDPNAGWKGRGLWVTSGNRTPAHIEGIDAPVAGRARQDHSHAVEPDGRAIFSYAPIRSRIERIGAAGRKGDLTCLEK